VIRKGGLNPPPLLGSTPAMAFGEYFDIFRVLSVIRELYTDVF